MRIRKIMVMGCMLVAVVACHHAAFSPKPRGYYRISFPKKEYVSYRGGCPFSFRYPSYARVVADTAAGSEPCWINLDFPMLNGKLHVSYKKVMSQKMLGQLTEDARAFAYKHTVKATDIEEIPIFHPRSRIYGMYYQIDGNAASSVQFYLTDSQRHYFRGALYFNVAPQIDSIQPVLDFVKTDLDTLINSFQWK